MTGMKKKVMKRIPFLLMNSATVPQLPQRICWPEGSEPHVTKRVPTRKMKNNAALPYFPAPAFFADFLADFLAADFDPAAPDVRPARSSW